MHPSRLDTKTQSAKRLDMMTGSHSSVGLIDIKVVRDSDHSSPAATACQFFKDNLRHMTIMPEDSDYKQESEG